MAGVQEERVATTRKKTGSRKARKKTGARKARKQTPRQAKPKASPKGAAQKKASTSPSVSRERVYTDPIQDLLARRRRAMLGR